MEFPAWIWSKACALGLAFLSSFNFLAAGAPDFGSIIGGGTTAETDVDGPEFGGATGQVFYSSLGFAEGLVVSRSFLATITDLTASHSLV